jgi:predicted enzyme related to lactoylglutathione lyase
MLLSVNIPVSNADKSERFYKYLLGDTLGEHPHFKQALYTNVGTCALTMFPRHQAEEKTTCYFGVEDLNKAIQDLENLGGNLLVKPFSIKAGSINRQAAVVADPDGNGVGLVSNK